ncbi:MAG: flippase-like domain-containing protein [Saprospiraceae bacterium]|nr:flippase-like domain-containing protein [Saprospiraceae bacterium]MCB0574453.1 flippase-like domain-containing protein [Saprospiraceae bacterium]MCB9355438.1 flippase-like domain-containing protein [Lewinellaceae bacterium]
MLKKTLQFLLFLGIGVAILTLVFRSQNAAFQEQCRIDGIPAKQCSLTDKLLGDFSTVHIGWLLMVVAAFTLSNIFRALRWQMLMEPMGHRAGFGNALLTILLGYFANLGFPRMGEVVRAGTLSRYERIPMEKVMGTLVTDRLMDFVCLIVVVGLAFVFEGQTLLDFIGRQQGGAEGGLLQNSLILTAFGLMIAGGIGLFLFREKLMHLPVYRKIAKLAKGFWDGLRSVFKLKQPALFLLYSAGIWLMFYLQCWFNLLAFPPTAQLGAGAALMVFVFGTLGFVIPSPGGMGTFHALAIAGLALYNINGGDAFSYANIAFFTIQIIYNIVAGVLSLILLPIINRRSTSAEQVAEA